MKILDLLPSGFIDKVVNFLEEKFTLAVSVTNEFAVFINGAEVLGTRQSVQAPVLGEIVTVTGECSVSVLDINTDKIEIRNVGNLANVKSINGANSASLIINKVG